jgi:hypothetical protein
MQHEGIYKGWCVMSMFISSNELAELTGYKVGFYQAQWLKDHGYPYELTISGKPRVLRAFVEKRLGLASVIPKSQTEPDFSSWKRAA